MRSSTKVFVFVGMVLLGAGFFARTNKQQSLGLEASQERVGEPLRSKMRTLWGDHISFTRNYIISALAGLADKDTVAKRLLENQDDIAGEFKPYYGLTFSDKLAALLRSHIGIAAEVVKATQTGNSSVEKKAQAKWAANGVEITTLLCGANPHWPQGEMAAMLKDHLELTTLEIRARMAKDWKGDIENYDKLHAHMLMFSDLLVTGLEQQFRKDPKGPSSLLKDLEASGRDRP